MTFHHVPQLIPMFDGETLKPECYEDFIIFLNRYAWHRCIKKIKEQIRNGYLTHCIVFTSKMKIELLFKSPDFKAQNYSLTYH